MAYSFGSPRAGYTQVSGGFNNTLQRLLPKDTVRYRIVDDGDDYFALWIYVQEYYEVMGQEYTRWANEYYTSGYTRDYSTVYVDIVHNVTRTFMKKKTIEVDKIGADNRFYDPSLDERLGGEVMTLGE
jgi:hypothetical protein